jgi:hypothetical protein
MGGILQVRVSCVHECTCDGLLIDAHNAERISPLDLVYLTARVTPALVAVGGSAGGSAGGGRCGVTLTVQPTSASGEHKFKLTALFLNRHGDGAFFGRWIFSQAQEARGAVSVAERAEADSRHRKTKRVASSRPRARRRAAGR